MANSNKKQNKTIILEELESVRSLLDEDDQEALDQELSAVADTFAKASHATNTSANMESTTNPDRDQNTRDLFEDVEEEPRASGSVFDEISSINQSMDAISEKDLAIFIEEFKDKAELVIEDLIAEIVPDLKKKLNSLVPDLEGKLKKQLRKEMNAFIEKEIK